MPARLSSSLSWPCQISIPWTTPGFYTYFLITHNLETEKDMWMTHMNPEHTAKGAHLEEYKSLKDPAAVWTL